MPSANTSGGGGKGATSTGRSPTQTHAWLCRSAKAARSSDGSPGVSIAASIASRTGGHAPQRANGSSAVLSPYCIEGYLLGVEAPVGVHRAAGADLCAVPSNSRELALHRLPRRMAGTTHAGPPPATRPPPARPSRRRLVQDPG